MGHCYGTVEIETANWVNSILDKFKKKSYNKASNDTGANETLFFFRNWSI